MAVSRALVSKVIYLWHRNTNSLSWCLRGGIPTKEPLSFILSVSPSLTVPPGCSAHPSTWLAGTSLHLLCYLVLTPAVSLCQFIQLGHPSFLSSLLFQSSAVQLSSTSAAQSAFQTHCLDQMYSPQHQSGGFCDVQSSCGAREIFGRFCHRPGVEMGCCQSWCGPWECFGDATVPAWEVLVMLQSWCRNSVMPVLVWGWEDL